MANLLASNDLLCLNEEDVFGNPVDFSLFGSYKYGVYRGIDVIYRPCIPTERNSVTENKCTVDDASNHTEVQGQLDASKRYVGEARMTIIMNQ